MWEWQRHWEVKYRQRAVCFFSQFSFPPISHSFIFQGLFSSHFSDVLNTDETQCTELLDWHTHFCVSLWGEKNWSGLPGILWKSWHLNTRVAIVPELAEISGLLIRAPSREIPVQGVQHLCQIYGCCIRQLCPLQAGDLCSYRAASAHPPASRAGAAFALGTFFWSSEACWLMIWPLLYLLACLEVKWYFFHKFHVFKELSLQGAWLAKVIQTELIKYVFVKWIVWFISSFQIIYL